MSAEKLKRGAKILLAVSIAAGLALEGAALAGLLPDGHGPEWKSYWFHHFPPFYTLMGLVGCMLIVYVSKWLGKLWLQRPEGHYEADDEEAPGG